MNEALLASLLAQLDSIVDDFAAMRSRSRHDDLSDLPQEERQSLMTRAAAAVRRISGESSTYSRELERIVKANPALHVHGAGVIGVVRALRHDVQHGYLSSVVELIHGAVFGDFLEMAQGLLDSGYKDAAAVVAGASLESHLRELCHKNGVPVVDGNGRPKKADLLNSELAKTAVHSALDQKNVTAWLGLRNKAAHGEYGDYSVEQVRLLISGVLDYLIRVPA